MGRNKCANEDRSYQNLGRPTAITKSKVIGNDGEEYVPELWNGMSKQLPQGHWPTYIVWREQMFQDLKELDI